MAARRGQGPREAARQAGIWTGPRRPGRHAVAPRSAVRPLVPLVPLAAPAEPLGHARAGPRVGAPRSLRIPILVLVLVLVLVLAGDRAAARWRSGRCRWWAWLCCLGCSAGRGGAGVGPSPAGPAGARRPRARRRRGRVAPRRQPVAPFGPAAEQALRDWLAVRVRAGGRLQRRGRAAAAMAAPAAGAATPRGLGTARPARRGCDADARSMLAQAQRPACRQPPVLRARAVPGPGRPAPGRVAPPASAPASGSAPAGPPARARAQALAAGTRMPPVRWARPAGLTAPTAAPSPGVAARVAAWQPWVEGPPGSREPARRRPAWRCQRRRWRWRR